MPTSPTNYSVCWRPATRRPPRRWPGQWSGCAGVRNCSSRLTAEVDAGGSQWRQATIWEVQRARPVSDFVLRRAMTRIRLGEWVIPEGTTLMINVPLAHSSEDNFPDAESFDPDRFVDTRPEGWIPFGGGFQRCIGATFANMAMDVTLRTLLREFRLVPTEAPGERPRDHGVIFAPEKRRLGGRLPANGGRRAASARRAGLGRLELTLTAPGIARGHPSLTEPGPQQRMTSHSAHRGSLIRDTVSQQLKGDPFAGADQQRMHGRRCDRRGVFPARVSRSVSGVMPRAP